MVNDILSVSERVVRSVATETDTDPLELPQLYETIDPDALDTFVNVTADGEVCFRYAGYAVTVESSGAIHLDDRLTASDVSEDVGSDGLD